MVSPVMLIFPLKEYPSFQDASLQRFFGVFGQSKGWITRGIFSSWIRNVRSLFLLTEDCQVFLPDVKRQREKMGEPNCTAILWLDGHKSHECADDLKLLQESNVW